MPKLSFPKDGESSAQASRTPWQTFAFSVVVALQMFHCIQSLCVCNPKQPGNPTAQQPAYFSARNCSFNWPAASKSAEGSKPSFREPWKKQTYCDKENIKKFRIDRSSIWQGFCFVVMIIMQNHANLLGFSRHLCACIFHDNEKLMNKTKHLYLPSPWPLWCLVARHGARPCHFEVQLGLPPFQQSCSF